MKKSKESQLYELIRALSPAEKKYVRLNISKFRPADENKNLLLFDRLNQQKKHDPKSVPQAYRLAGYRWQYLAADRNKLYDLILESIRDFNRKNSAEVRVSEGVQKTILLFEKKLFSQALGQIERSGRLAKQHEFYSELLSLQTIKHRILKVLGRLDEALEVLKKQDNLWQQQKTVNQYIQIHYQSIKLRVALAKARNEQQSQQFDQLMQQAHLLAPPINAGFKAQFHYWETWCNYYFVKDNQSEELRCNQEIIRLMEQQDWYRQNQPLNLLAIHTRILAIERRLRPETFAKALTDYRGLADQFSKQKREAESVIFIFSYNYELDEYLVKNEWKSALSLLPEIDKGLKKHGNRISDALKITAHYRMAYSYFFNQGYSLALDHLGKILNDFPPALRPDVYNISMIFQALVHYELGNYRLVVHLLKTAKYHLSKRQSLHQTENLVIAQLKKLSKAPKPAAKVKLFQKFIADLNLLQKNDYERRVLGLFDFEAWAWNNLNKAESGA